MPTAASGSSLRSSPPPRQNAPRADRAPGAPATKPPKRSSGLGFVREFLRALIDDRTYDLGSNPSLWVGFIMALPIPFLTVAAHPPTWLSLMSIPAPFFWAVVVGAAGRVGIRAAEQAEELERTITKTINIARATERSYEAALGEEVEKRRGLEQREQSTLSELQLAQAVHRTLIPNSIQRDDIDVAVQHIPALHVGGDYLFAAVVQNRWVYLCIGDVSGHGVAAALVVARLHGLIRRLTLENRARPVTILERLNRAAFQLFQHTYFFMTFGVFRLDMQTRRLRYATAGHPAQVLLRKAGDVELLRTPNRLLGIDSDIFDSKRPSDSVILEPGDSLVLFTDGLFEIPSGKDGEVLGEPGLYDRIANVKGLNPQLMAGEILQELADYQGHSHFGDDVSLMVATWNGQPDEAKPSA